MNRLNHKIKKLYYFSILCNTLLLVSFSTKAQNYVANSSEITIHSAIDFSSSPSWETNKSLMPGFFTWLDNAEIYGGATDVSHVNGYVKKIGNDDFIFPIGSGIDLRTLQISAPASISSEIAVSWIPGNPSTTSDPTNSNQFHSTNSKAPGINDIVTIGQWDWLSISGVNSGLTITVSVPQLSGFYYSSSSDVRLVGWNGTQWVLLGTTGATGLSENSLLSGTMIDGIQAIGIGSVKSVMPSVAAPVFVVEQNIDGSLSIKGTAIAGISLLITFPDGSTKNTVANSQGQFGPISSNLPQVLKATVKVLAIDASGVSSVDVVVPYEFEPIASVSEAFTPNGDGINDTWMIYQLDKYPNTSVRVFNRWGSEVYFSNNYQNDWDGHFNSSSSVLPQSSSYYYQIDFNSNGSIDKQGWLYIKR